jgi:hypothetical protein
MYFEKHPHPNPSQSARYYSKWVHVRWDNPKPTTKIAAHGYPTNQEIQRKLNKDKYDMMSKLIF